MDLENSREDFFKRYQRDANVAVYSGMPLIFSESDNGIAGTSISAFGALVLAPRNDGRITIGFSDSTDFFTANVNELSANNNNEIFDALLKFQEIGIKLGGADILFYYNTPLNTPSVTLLAAACPFFCENVPKGTEIIRHFPDYSKNLTGLLSRKDCAVIAEAKGTRYAHLPASEIKIVISTASKNTKIKRVADNNTEIYDALLKGDLAKFGESLNRKTARLLEKSKPSMAGELFYAAKNQKYALGSGIMENVGIFSIVENKFVDSFMQSLSAYCGMYLGKRPDFYVTDALGAGKVNFLTEEN